MKKSLLAVAVASALPSLALAQSNVTLYGLADIGMAWEDGGGNGQNQQAGALRVQSGIMATSRWGIRGEEDLGGGLKAVFNYEGGFKTDTGGSDAYCAVSVGGTSLTTTGTCPDENRNGLGYAGGLFQRRAVLGLSGSFGQVLMGRDYTPGFSALGNWDILGYGLYGNALNFSIAPVGVVVNGNSLATGFTGSAVRWSNSIQWISPLWSGFTVRAMYAAGEFATESKQRRNAFGLSGVYAAGPLTVAAFYELEKDGNGSTGQYTPSQAVTPVLNPGTVSVNEANKWGLGGQYNFGTFRVALGYAMTDPDGPAKLQYWNLGGGIKLGPGELRGQYSEMKTNFGISNIQAAKSQTWAIAYVYPMSRRTDLYATYGIAVNNDTSGAGTSGTLRASDVTVTAGALGKDPQAFGVGIRHSF